MAVRTNKRGCIVFYVYEEGNIYLSLKKLWSLKWVSLLSGIDCDGMGWDGMGLWEMGRHRINQ